MFLQTAIKHSLARSWNCSRCLRYSQLSMSILPIVQFQRNYATNPNPKFKLPPENTEEVFKSLANNPDIMKALHNVIEIFNRRGMPLDKEPDVSSMWKIAKDKEITNALNERSNIPFPL